MESAIQQAEQDWIELNSLHSDVCGFQANQLLSQRIAPA